MLMDFMDQGFTQGRVRIVCVCSMTSGTSARKTQTKVMFEAGCRNYMEASSFNVWLMGWSDLGFVGSVLVCLPCGFFMWLGLPHSMVALA